MKYDLEEIKAKKETLENARVELKKHFVGIDDIIDKVIEKVELWWVMPQLVDSPIIICLFGMTGVGKTDLIRRLVALLDLEDVYFERTLKGKVGSDSTGSVRGLLNASQLVKDKPCVMLFDEIQKLRTVSENGSEILDVAYQDIWDLLSDGKFPSTVLWRKQKLYEHLFRIERDRQWDRVHKRRDIEKRAEKKLLEGESAEKVKSLPKETRDRIKEVLTKYIEEEQKEEEYCRDVTLKTDYYSCNNLKKDLALTDSIEEISAWSREKKKEKILQAINDKKNTYGGDSYKKSLIFISGNIDEAYADAFDTDNADLCADVYHERTKLIDLLAIKDALRCRFKAEQIARFGNNIIVYPSLSKHSYEQIIKRNIERFIATVTDTSGVSITVDESVRDFVYRNGVFPVQGTRPVFTTLKSVVYSHIPEFTLEAIENGVKSINVYYDKMLCCDIGDKVSKKDVKGELDALREKKEEQVDLRYAVSVHEAGHAVVQSVLFGEAPKEIRSQTISNKTRGHVTTVNYHDNQNYYHRMIKVLLAGQAAEEIVFGQSFCSGGSSSDLKKATEIAANMIRKQGIHNSQHFNDFTSPNRNQAYQETDTSDKEIQKLIQRLSSETHELLLGHVNFFSEVIEILGKKKRIEPEHFIEIAKKYDVELQMPQENVIPDYKSKFETWKKKVQASDGYYNYS